MIELQSVAFSYRDKSILSNVSFLIQKGEIVSLIGSSGSGKTTLFRLITGMGAPSHGKILIGGLPLAAGKNLITYMRQEDLLLPWRNVLNNLLLFTELGTPQSREKLLPEARQLLKQVGLEGCEDLYPEELSGGMRQRVSLARALLQKRPLLLLDEPFGPLDVIIREELYQLLREIAVREGKTILFVTHDFHDALALSNRILILREGKITSEFQLNDEMRSNPAAKEEVMGAIRRSLISSDNQPPLFALQN